MVFQSDVLNGKTALVTGGGTGICRGIALALAKHGCDVAITSRRAEHLDPTAEEIRAYGVKTAAVAADVRDPAAIEAAVDQAVELSGRLDILVNGAAGNFLCLAEELSPNGFGAVVDIDLKGTFHASKAALSHLKKQGGVVLNISSTLQYVGTAAQLHVSAAKAGVDALTRVLAVEWGAHGIRVNGIAPRAGCRHRGCTPIARRAGAGPCRGQDAAGSSRDDSGRRRCCAFPVLRRCVVRHWCHAGRRWRAMAFLERNGGGVGREHYTR